nr:ComEC/Rec2 family competence protein [Aquimarina mytili]
MSTIIGIVLGYYLTIDIASVLFSFFVAITLLGISWKRSKKIFHKGISFSFITIIAFIIFGFVLVNIHNPKNDAEHYTNLFSSTDFSENSYGIQFHIKERLKPSNYYLKYIVSIGLLENKIAKGQLLLLIPRDSLNTTLEIGDSYTAFAKIKPIPIPLNPDQFNYAKHMKKQYVYHQLRVSNYRLLNNHNPRWSILSLTDKLRKHINTQLTKHSFTSEQLSIINALLLGQRQDIDQQTFYNYRDAGAIHILAVSGLHVGIILLILNMILKPLDRYKRQGKIFKLVITLILLWCFAIIAGLSPSVIRAVTMFSFMAIGAQIKSKTSIYNSLFVSMFVLLCFNPLLLFSVGFQLSYLAVFAIVWMQPILARRYNPKFYFTKKIWETFTVTIAAQLGLLPLTLFYFHQFPGLFFVSNLIIIPFLGGILTYGIIVIILASIGILPQPIASLFGNCIDLMNGFIGWVARQHDFIITEIPFSWRMLGILYIVIITGVTTLQKHERRRPYSLITSIIMMMFIVLYEKHTVSNREELIIYNNYRNTTIGVLKNQKLQVYSKHKISIKAQSFLFGNYRIKNHTSLDTTFITLKNTYQYKKHAILIIDSTSIYAIKKFQPDIIILSNSPKIHLERVINKLCPQQIVADGSNYKSYIDRWEKSCTKNNISFHRTDKKGAFILK